MEESDSGIGAFNINLKSFLFQLATFVIVLLVLRRWVFPKLTATIEARRKTLEESLVKAKETEEALVRAEEKAGQIIQTAREQADRALADANSQAKDIIAKSETAADAQAKRLIDEAKERLDHEHLKLQGQLRGELADLVIMTTEKVLRQKVNESEDRRLVENAVKELARD
ncbi:MAG TPA: F0F1 ATP synthase subunit B [Candidatus Saccharimonadales bacterium]|nr:F0F1 ATP synthase subunit B [Candidatus Saccharimonadales bacterium]